MNDPRGPQGPFSESPQRTNPEMSKDRDALNLVRKHRRRPTKSLRASGKFQLTMPIKIGAIALIFTGIVLSIWTMKSTNTPLNDEDLPILSADLNMEDFKVAPSDDDEIPVPHSDKEFYSELDSSTSKKKDTLLKAPERPAKQISQEALFAENSSLKAQEDAAIPPTKEAEKVDVKVVENANKDIKKVYRAPALKASESKLKKTLEMAIKNTQSKVDRPENPLPHGKILAQGEVKKDIPFQGKPTVAKPAIKKGNAPKKVTPALAVAAAKTKKTKAANGLEYWIQVASLPTQATAQKEAKRLQKKSAQELKSQKYRTIRVDLGKPKGIRYRVHFGPFPREKAVQKCKNLTGNEKISCLVVKG